MEAALELFEVHKRFGVVPALRGVSLRAAPGRVCGLLGANAAGKSTALRCLLGLARPHAGRALVAGVPFAALASPARTVGAVLESVGLRPDRSGRDHLRVAPRRVGVAAASVDELLELVDLADAGRRPVAGWSLGMRQRLAVATARLGEPAALVLDEPANGLDPPGRRWLADLLRGLARAGHTVLLSSHVLAEVERLADDVVLLHEGRVLASGPLEQLRAGTADVRTPDTARLERAVTEAGGSAVPAGDGRLRVRGLDAAALGQAILRAGVEVHELQRRRLEDVVAELTESAR